jgi:crooked neck
MALGKCPRRKIFKAYAELELNLGEIDRCRTIYEKFVSVFKKCFWDQFKCVD